MSNNTWKKMLVLCGIPVLAVTACSSDQAVTDDPAGIEQSTPDVEQITPEPRTNENVTITGHSFILGDVNNSNTITVYQDFNCPHCLNLHGLMSNGNKVSDWIEHDSSIEYVPVNYLGARTTHDFSTRAANALTLVADKYPEYFVQAQEELFNIQPKSTIENVSNDKIHQALEDAGVKLTDEDKRNLDGVAYRDWIENATDVAAAKGINYIPQLWLNGSKADDEDYDTMISFVDNELKKSHSE